MQVKITFESPDNHGKTTLREVFQRLLDVSGINHSLQESDDPDTQVLIVRTGPTIQHLRAYPLSPDAWRSATPLTGTRDMSASATEQPTLREQFAMAAMTAAAMSLRPDRDSVDAVDIAWKALSIADATLHALSAGEEP